MALLLPVGVLVAAELLLRVFGFGYPVHFFVPAGDGTPGLYVENPRFGWRFFPRRLARAPDPIRISERKAPGTYRIFVFGESAALGDPEPAYGFSRILREVLESRCPGNKFEIVNVGMTAINSHVILPIARDCVPFNADLWILYAGNNEVIGPFGAGSVFGTKALPLPLVRLLLAAKRTYLGQALDAMVQRSRARGQATEAWEGMKMFLHERIRSDDPALERVYHSFRKNVSDIISLGARHHVKTIVCSVSSNLRDCPPFASVHRTNLSEPQEVQWTNLVARGAQLDSAGQFPEALAQYQQAAQIDDRDAVLAFRMARSYQAAGQPALALQQFERARDLDALRFRADSTINVTLRSLCSSGRLGRSYFDSESTIRDDSPGRIPGAESFWDHVHFNFHGNYRIASGLAERVIAEMALAPQAQGPILTEAECAERLAFTDWDQFLVLDQMWRRVHEPPFTDQLDHGKLLETWAALRSNLRQKATASRLAKAAEVYRRALQQRPDDWVLHHRFAGLLEASGDLAGAEEQWKEVIAHQPDYPDALFKLGEVCASQSKIEEALSYYRQVLRIRPGSFEAMNGLGLVFLSQGSLRQAAEFFELALKTNPKFALAHVNLGLVAARAGSPTKAEFHYREALRADSECAAAHINLGNLLAAQAKHPEAISHFLEAARAEPDKATVHLALANSLQAVGRSSDAIAQYRQAIQIDPALPEAQFNLGVALAEGNDFEGAAARFKAAVQLTPADPQAHLNLGVALARQGRLHDAIPEFEAVLRLDPANQSAQQFLKTALRMQDSGGESR